MCAIRRNVSGSCSRIQQEAGRGRDRHPVAALLVDPPGVAALDELGGLAAGTRVDVRAGPDLAALGVVEHHAFAHARAAHRHDVRRGDGRAIQRLAGCTRRSRSSCAACRRPAIRARQAAAACDHSRWPIAAWLPSSSNRTARQLPVPRSMASVCFIAAIGGGGADAVRRCDRRRCRSGSPPRYRSISAAAISPPCRRVSSVAPPMWVVTITFGWSSSGCRPTAGEG